MGGCYEAARMLWVVDRVLLCDWKAVVTLHNRGVAMLFFRVLLVVVSVLLGFGSRRVLLCY